MVSQAGPTAVRTSMSMNLQFTRGRHGAAARLEVHERPAGRVGLMALRGAMHALSGAAIHMMVRRLGLLSTL